ncbi:MAG: carboxypeptidase regulatory-like domain-containing protein [Acidobacteria bacterium]|nr:carboxypeptidase regulatory-like domain-containing protein [Acidobacteriota bacterium]
MRKPIAWWLLYTVLAVLACGVGFSPAALSQARQDPYVRYGGDREDSDPDSAIKTLTGQVVDKQGQGLAQAVVHMKNKKTLAVKTHIADDNGSFRIVGLNRDTDYAVHAEYRGKASSPRTVSSFDDRSEVYVVLEIDASK